MTSNASSVDERTYHSSGNVVTVRLVDGPRDDELVRYVERCGSRLVHECAPLEVIISPHRYGAQVRIQGIGAPYPVVETEADVLVAIRNAFARLDAAASLARAGGA